MPLRRNGYAIRCMRWWACACRCIRPRRNRRPTPPVARRRARSRHDLRHASFIGTPHMIGEIDILGVFVPAVLVLMFIAYLVNLAIRTVLARAGFYRFVWHRSIFDLG